MPYKDSERQKAAVKKYQQDHLFELREYQRNIPKETRDRYLETQRRQRMERGRRFVGVDGEGHGDGYGHNYYTLRAGDKLLRTGRPLTTTECLSFLSDLTPLNTYVIFSGTYDCTMILRGIPIEFLRNIFDRESRKYEDAKGKVQFAPVEWNGFLIDYMPHKHISVARVEKPHKLITVHDVFGFKQSSILKEVETWDVATPTEMRILIEGKAARDTADALSDETDHYNHTECIVLAKLVTALDDATRAVGLDAKPYEGAGCLASSMYTKYVAQPHKQWNLPRRPPVPPDDVPVMAGYYGGRFETSAVGPIKGTVHEYDIASAYPYAMTQLPCLWHGEWVNSNVRNAKVRLAHIKWSPSHGPMMWGPLPVRNKIGNITFPLCGGTYAWDVEWPNEAQWNYTVDNCWSFVQNCDCHPYNWIYSLYRARQSMGKSGKGYVIKLGLNSLYGKTAQSVGSAPWANFALAGLITAHTRAMVRGAIELDPFNSIMIATDGVYSRKPLSLPLSTELGGWEHKTFENFHIVQPGVYFDGVNAKVKTRGISQATLIKYQGELKESFNRVYDSEVTKEDWGISVEYNGLVPLKLAVAQNNLPKAGYFGKLRRHISYWTEPKRPIASLKEIDGVWRTSAPIGHVGVESIPYKGTSMLEHDTEEIVSAAPQHLSGVQELLW